MYSRQCGQAGPSMIQNLLFLDDLLTFELTGVLCFLPEGHPQYMITVYEDMSWHLSPVLANGRCHGSIGRPCDHCTVVAGRANQTCVLL